MTDRFTVDHIDIPERRKSADQALADKVVALGVGSRKDTAYYRGINYEVLTADLFVRDPRVAMALMQKAWPDICLYWHEFYEAVNKRLNGKSISELPRAITEACVEALTDLSTKGVK